MRKHINLTYITVMAPLGKGEAFITDEMVAVKKAGINLFIVPRSVKNEHFHHGYKYLAKNTFHPTIKQMEMLLGFVVSMFQNGGILKSVISVINNSRNIKIMIKNLLVAPKALFISKILKKKHVNHIHCHWGSTTATMAYIISKLTGIPWSITLHRWDIYEDNMLKEKAKSAQFIRCISQKGKSDLKKILKNEFKEKIKVIHMGTIVPVLNRADISIKLFKCENNDIFTILTPGSLLPVKGHVYLIDALKLLIKMNVNNFKCIFYGDGPLLSYLKRYIRDRGLCDYIFIGSSIPHNKLIGMYRRPDVDIVVLPSINTDSGEHEGIPVSLMEAMAWGVPVVSTKTGSINELIPANGGLIVNEKSAIELAYAIMKFMTKRNNIIDIVHNNYKAVYNEFNIDKTTQQLLEMI